LPNYPESGAVAAALQQRYGASPGSASLADIASRALPAAAGPATLESLERLLQHRSVRAYQRRPVPRGTLELLVAAAQSTMRACSASTLSKTCPRRRGGWSVHSAQRVASAESLRGRDLLRQALRGVGFELR